jgi:hypothetical protein
VAQPCIASGHSRAFAHADDSLTQVSPLAGEYLVPARPTLTTSGAPTGSSTVIESAATLITNEETIVAHPRLQDGICKAKVYTDGTICYGCIKFVASGL